MKAALPLIAATSLLSACIPASRAPEPASVPTPVSSAPARTAASTPPMQVRAVVPAEWMRMADTPGMWRLAASGSGSEARFVGEDGSLLASLRCDPRAPAVIVSLPGAGTASGALEIRTETMGMTLPARERAAVLPADLPLLDAMALSKGRFAIGAEGQGALILPAWAEVSRVIEDCRS